MFYSWVKSMHDWVCLELEMDTDDPLYEFFKSGTEMHSRIIKRKQHVFFVIHHFLILLHILLV